MPLLTVQFETETRQAPRGPVPRPSVREVHEIGTVAEPGYITAGIVPSSGVRGQFADEFIVTQIQDSIDIGRNSYIIIF